MFLFKYLILVSVFLSVESFLNTSLSSERSCSISWLYFTTNDNCLNVIGKSVPNCVYRSLFDLNVRVKTYDSYSRFAPLTTANKSNCERFLQTDADLDQLKSIINRGAKFFYTFTRVFIIDFSSGAKSIFNTNEIQYMYKNVINVYVIDASNSDLDSDQNFFKFNKIRNVVKRTELDLSKTKENSLKCFYGNRLDYPILDVKDPKNNVSVSFFNCSLFVIFLEDEHKNPKLVSYPWIW